MFTVIGAVVRVAEFCTHPEKNNSNTKMNVNPEKILSIDVFFGIIVQN
jgi:hypothetical protein